MSIDFCHHTGRGNGVLMIDSDWRGNAGVFTRKGGKSCMYMYICDVWCGNGIVYACVCMCMHMYAYNCCTNVSIYRDMMYLHVLRLLPGTRAYFGGCKIVQMQFLGTCGAWHHDNTHKASPGAKWVGDSEQIRIETCVFLPAHDDMYDITT